MPVINFKYSDLCTMLGREVSQDVLVERIPMIGADMHETESGCEDMSVEFFPDRPDLYSVEGLARGMRAFLDIEPDYGGRYRKKCFRYYLTISFQFHHTQMDGAHAGRFLQRPKDVIRKVG